MAVVVAVVVGGGGVAIAAIIKKQREISAGCILLHESHCCPIYIYVIRGKQLIDYIHAICGKRLELFRDGGGRAPEISSIIIMPGLGLSSVELLQTGTSGSRQTVRSTAVSELYPEIFVGLSQSSRNGRPEKRKTRRVSCG